MTREEFLSQLRLTLQGKVSSDKVQENINYYNDYIIEEVRKGKSEAEVLEMLGDPGLLAKTIIAAAEADGSRQKVVYDAEDGSYSSESERDLNGRRIMMPLDNWWQKLLLILVIVMAVLLIVAVVSGLVRIFAPILVPVIVIMFIVRMFGRRK